MCASCNGYQHHPACTSKISSQLYVTNIHYHFLKAKSIWQRQVPILGVIARLLQSHNLCDYSVHDREVFSCVHEPPEQCPIRTSARSLSGDGSSGQGSIKGSRAHDSRCGRFVYGELCGYWSNGKRDWGSHRVIWLCGWWESGISRLSGTIYFAFGTMNSRGRYWWTITVYIYCFGGFSFFNSKKQVKILIFKSPRKQVYISLESVLFACSWFPDMDICGFNLSHPESGWIYLLWETLDADYTFPDYTRYRNLLNTWSPVSIIYERCPYQPTGWKPP